MNAASTCGNAPTARPARFREEQTPGEPQASDRDVPSCSAAWLPAADNRSSLSWRPGVRGRPPPSRSGRMPIPAPSPGFEPISSTTTPRTSHATLPPASTPWRPSMNGTPMPPRHRSIDRRGPPASASVDCWRHGRVVVVLDDVHLHPVDRVADPARQAVGCHTSGQPGRAGRPAALGGAPDPSPARRPGGLDHHRRPGHGRRRGRCASSSRC